MGAIEDARAEAARAKLDLNRRGTAAKGEIDSVYKSVIAETSGLNAAINKTYADAQAAAQIGGQSMIDAIIKANTLAKTGVKSTLGAANIQGVGTESMDEALNPSEAIARNLAHTTNTNYSMLGTAQKAMGSWAVSGLQHDQSERKLDITRDITNQLAGIDENLADYIKRIRAQQAAEAARRRYYNSRRSYSSGGSYRRGGGSYRSGGSSRSGMPSDAIRVPDNYIRYMKQGMTPQEAGVRLRLNQTAKRTGQHYAADYGAKWRKSGGRSMSGGLTW